MNIISLNGHVFDLDELASTELRATSVFLTFKNGDSIDLAWRDNSERNTIFRSLDLSELNASS
jgi:hypothetical protein